MFVPDIWEILKYIIDNFESNCSDENDIFD